MPSVEVEIDGKTYTCSYEIQGEMIEVSYRGKTKKSKLGGYAGNPEILVSFMIDEFVREEQQRSTGD